MKNFGQSWWFSILFFILVIIILWIVCLHRINMFANRNGLGIIMKTARNTTPIILTCTWASPFSIQHQLLLIVFLLSLLFLLLFLQVYLGCHQFVFSDCSVLILLVLLLLWYSNVLLNTLLLVIYSLLFCGIFGLNFSLSLAQLWFELFEVQCISFG